MGHGKDMSIESSMQHGKYQVFHDGTRERQTIESTRQGKYQVYNADTGMTVYRVSSMRHGKYQVFHDGTWESRL